MVGESPGEGNGTKKLENAHCTRGIRRDNKRESRELENYYYVLWALHVHAVQYQATTGVKWQGRCGSNWLGGEDLMKCSLMLLLIVTNRAMLPRESKLYDTLQWMAIYVVMSCNLGDWGNYNLIKNCKNVVFPRIGALFSVSPIHLCQCAPHGMHSIEHEGNQISEWRKYIVHCPGVPWGGGQLPLNPFKCTLRFVRHRRLGRLHSRWQRRIGSLCGHSYVTCVPCIQLANT